MLSPAICRSKNTRTLLPKQIPFLELHFLNLDDWRQNSAWQRDRQLHISEWLESLSSEQELEGCLPLWKGMVATKCPAQDLHLTGRPLGRGSSFVCVNPRLLLSMYPKLSIFPWSPLGEAHTVAFLPPSAPPCYFALLLPSHFNRPFSSPIYQMQPQRDHLINRLPLCGEWLGSLKPFKKPHTIPDDKNSGTHHLGGSFCWNRRQYFRD